MNKLNKNDRRVLRNKGTLLVAEMNNMLKEHPTMIICKDPSTMLSCKLDHCIAYKLHRIVGKSRKIMAKLNLSRALHARQIKEQLRKINGLSTNDKKLYIPANTNVVYNTDGNSTIVTLPSDAVVRFIDIFDGSTEDTRKLYEWVYNSQSMDDLTVFRDYSKYVNDVYANVECILEDGPAYFIVNLRCTTVDIVKYNSLIKTHQSISSKISNHYLIKEVNDLIKPLMTCDGETQ